MLMIGCDFHTRFRQIAMLDPETGELTERRLEHATGEAMAFYGAPPGPARVGWKRAGTLIGSKRCLRSKGMNSGWETRLRFGQRWYGSRKRIRATLLIYSICCSRIAFHGSGFRHRLIGMRGNSYGIGTSWFAYGPR